MGFIKKVVVALNVTKTLVRAGIPNLIAPKVNEITTASNKKITEKNSVASILPISICTYIDKCCKCKN